MLTQEILKKTTFPVELVGKDQRLRYKAVLYGVLFYSEEHFTSTRTLMTRPNGDQIESSITHLYSNWELGEQSYDPNQNGDTEDDV